MAGWPGLSGGAHLVLRQPQASCKFSPCPGLAAAPTTRISAPSRPATWSHRHADTVVGLRVGLLGLGEQDVEAVRRGTRDAVGLPRVVADDPPTRPASRSRCPAGVKRRRITTTLAGRP